MLSYRDTSLTPQKRAEALLSIMTTDEKIAQLQCLFVQDIIDKDGTPVKLDLIGERGLGGLAFERIIMPHSLEKEIEILNAFQKWFRDNTRLGIPPFIHAEALHGLCLKGATSFPQAIGLASMWDTEMMEAVSRAIADECRVRGIRQVLSPTIDLARDLRWGRVEETYGEDPCLTARTAVSFCKSFEQKGIVTTPKHFVSNSGDGGRDSAAVFHSERILKNSYFIPYKACFEKAGSSSVMASYNALNSVPTGLNRWLLKDMLRGYLNFRGFVVTDYGLMERAVTRHRISPDYKVVAAKALKAGLNREIPSFLGTDGYSFLKQALDEGLVEMSELDEMVLDVLRVKFEKGLFDESPFLDKKAAREVTRCSRHHELALDAARESIVMLKNDGSLPLKGNERIAILGSLAKHPKLGGYATWDIDVSSLTAAMPAADYVRIQRDGNGEHFQRIESRYFRSFGPDGMEAGITGYYKDNRVYCGQPVLQRNDGCIDFDWTSSPVADCKELQPGNEFAVEWNGFLKVPKSGQYTFCIEANGGIKLALDGELLIDRFFDTVSDRQFGCYYLEGGREYPILVGFGSSGTSPRIRLSWNYGEQGVQTQPDYRALLAPYDTVLITAGVTEGEGSDRANLDLTQSMERLICDVADAGKKVVVIIYAGSAVTMKAWAHKVSGIFHVWYPGEAGGQAIADILCGRYNPAGRLPLTFPQHVAQAPMYYNQEPRGRNSGYSDMTDKPLFPFGFGLSYTEFVYGNAALQKAVISPEERTQLRVDVTNAGDLDGDEVVQLYIRDEYASVAMPELALKDFRRVPIRRGETKTVTFDITPEHLQLLDETLHWVVEPGDFTILLGASSADIRASVPLRVTEERTGRAIRE